MSGSELEDGLSDIVGKAARGTGGWMAKGNAVNLVTEGARFGLDPAALRLIRDGRYPLPPPPPGPIRRLVLPFQQFTVNAWLLGPDDDAILVDGGFEADARSLLAALPEVLGLRAVLLTHDDRDHWGGLPALARRFPGMSIYGPQGESPDDVRAIPPGPGPQLGGGWRLQVIPVPGHTPHGITWLVESPHFAAPLAACGDALFAGSIGMIRGDWTEGLATLRRTLLTLPDATVLLPGHGPPTTVGTERDHNPFLAKPAA